MGKNKYIKILVIILGILLIILIPILLLRGRDQVKYPDKPIPFNQLKKSELDLNISELRNFSETDLDSYRIEDTNRIQIIESIIEKMSLSLKKEEYNEGDLIIWKNAYDSFNYDSITGVLIFDLSKSISIYEGEESFSEFHLKYLEEDIKFVISKIEKSTDGETWYYASRLIEDIPVQLGYGKEYSDILVFNSKGELKGGTVLLVNTTREEYVVPIISKNELTKYLESKGYPKESYINFSVLNSFIDDTPYSFSSWGEDVIDEVYKCVGSEIEIIYLYKSINQSNLLPVYKIYASCDLEYKGRVFDIPATYYVNAVDPKYLTYTD